MFMIHLKWFEVSMVNYLFLNIHTNITMSICWKQNNGRDTILTITLITRRFNKYSVICILYFWIQRARVSINACDIWILYIKSTIDRSPKVNCKINNPSARLLHQKLSYLLIRYHTYISIRCKPVNIFLVEIQTYTLSRYTRYFLFRKSSTSGSAVDPDEHVVQPLYCTDIIAAHRLRNKVRHRFPHSCKNTMTSCNIR